MQTYKTVGDIIDFLEAYHRQLKEFYRKNQDTVNSEQVKMLHQSGIPAPVQEFFQHLIFLEEKEKTQVARAAQQIKDY